MTISRRAVLGLLAAAAVAGCSSDSPADGGDSTPEPEDSGPTTESLPGGESTDSNDTSLAGSCGAAFGDTLQAYDPGDRGMVATFSYPMGGKVTYQEDSDDLHITSLGYGRGEISPLHSMTISERGPYNDGDTAAAVYGDNDQYTIMTARAYGSERPIAVPKRDDGAVVWLFRAPGPDGTYEFAVQASPGEADPCTDAYESVVARVAESFRSR